MKKIILTLALVMGVVAAQAQVTLKGSKFTDNWSITVKGGAVMPFQHYAFWQNARGIFGAEIRKQITPVLGVGVEGEWTINTTSWNKEVAYWGPKSLNVIDHQFVGAFAALNLTNAFMGYKGTPRTFELEGVLGAGWLHAYHQNEALRNETWHGCCDDNSWYTKAGLNFNWNLGAEKAWTVSLKPSVLWDMCGDVDRMVRAAETHPVTRFNANHAVVELQAGVTYHFGNSNGTHHFALCDKKYTQADIDALNAEINDLRNRKPEVQVVEKVVEKIVEKPVEKVVSKTGESLESNVFFAQGKSVITNAQMPNVERVATFLKNHKDATVEIRGYASPEGSKEINERLAKARAAAVKDMLVKKYKVNANRIDAKGLGVGDMFSEPDWNRVSVCTILSQNK